MPSNLDTEPYLPLKPDVFLVLVILREGRQHGYALMKAASERSTGRIELQAGALYRRLSWMLDEGLISECADPEDSETSSRDRRRSYEITPLGDRVARAEAARMVGLVRGAGFTDLLGASESGR